MTELTLTPNAHLAITKRSAQLPDSPRAGLRIFPSDERPGKLQVAMTEAPLSGDTAIVDGEARVYCPPETRGEVDGARLDARRDGRGRLEFVIKRPADDPQ